MDGAGHLGFHSHVTYHRRQLGTMYFAGRISWTTPDAVGYLGHVPLFGRVPDRGHCGSAERWVAGGEEDEGA